ncbi:MAG TPA: D-glycero-beta-D-manno-heptose 1-phosphate adenylyltransferase [Bdellovibrionota bacterium]|nr:D-glycero-beta-D-manno-heptose 1-phosphate adenylyltransferase [Bdellovibrionota bacterium]
MKPRPARSKVLSPEALARKLARSKGKVVFTNGCFDLVHKGHVSYLERARTLGSQLVVGVNGDASVRRLKGKGRPVNPLADRLDVLAALEAVDFVTWFADDTPLALILKLRPDVLVKGQDYRLDQIVGAREVQGWGGRVKRLPYVKGRSTSAILARAGKRK